MSFVNDDHSWDVKGVPLSDVMCSGTPWRAIHVSRALVHEDDVASDIGIASGHLVLRSMMVKMYLEPSE